MKRWTLILFSFFLNLNSTACTFLSDVKNVYSLSGPITTGLKEWGLLKQPKLQGVSIFHPVSAHETKKFIPGGIFLSPKLIQEMSGAVVFYDESQELTKVFRDNKIKSVEIKTRGLIPSAVTSLVVQELSKYVSNCETQIENFKDKSTWLEQSVIHKLKNSPSLVFFLGEYVREKLPDLIMANDGVVKWLKLNQKIKTYPSDLPYVSWSARILNSMPKETTFILLKDSGSKMDKSVLKNTKQIISLVYPGALIPGINQLETLNYLFSEIY